jgi:RNA polymerase sigma-70 factor (ECF subfamily)
VNQPAGGPPRLGVLSGSAPPDWEAVYRDNIVSIYRLMYAKVGNQPDAEDLTSQVFLDSLPHLRPGSSSGEIHRYLMTTAQTVLANHWRRRLGVQLTTLDEEVAAAETGAEPDEARSAGTARRVHRVLGALPANYRSILELRFLSGCSIRESAARMGISVGNAKVVQHRALRRAAELGEQR